LNPYTQSLLRQLDDPRLAEFVAHWDRLETLVIRIYKGKSASPQDEAEHASLQAWLGVEYSNWQPSLAPFWPLALAAGRPLTEDPFALLISIPRAGDFVGNRPALTILPAARQALNQYLLERIGSGGSQVVW
jgi:hypothetical protein